MIADSIGGGLRVAHLEESVDLTVCGDSDIRTSPAAPVVTRAITVARPDLYRFESLRSNSRA